MSSSEPAAAATDRPHTWAVTGASGYLGSRLVRALAGDGVRTVALGRRPVAGTEFRAFTLGEPPAHGSLDGVDVLVHAAYDFAAARPDDVRRVNVDGSRRLLDQAAERSTRVVFVSSLSAFEGCRSVYGNAKLDVERAAFAQGGAVLRPGLLYGRHAGGIMGAMGAAVRALPIVPLVGDGHWVQYLGHVADVVRLIRHAAEAPPVNAVLVAASEQSRTLREIVRTLGQAAGHPRALLPIPVPVLFAALRAAELARVPLRTRTDSLVGLMYADTAPDFRATRVTGIAFRAFDERTAVED